MKIITVEDSCPTCNTNQIAVYWNSFLHKPQEYCVQCKQDERKAKRRLYMKKKRAADKELNKQVAALADKIAEALLVQNTDPKHITACTAPKGKAFLDWSESLG